MSNHKPARVGLGTSYQDVVSSSLRARKTIAFTGAAGLGATGAVPLFTITGKVLIDRIIGVCTEDLASAGGGTLALGVTGATTLLIAATTATDLDLDELWVSATPNANGIALPAALQNIAIAKDIIGTVGTSAITDGTLVIDVWYTPITDNGKLVAA